MLLLHTVEFCQQIVKLPSLSCPVHSLLELDNIFGRCVKPSFFSRPSQSPSIYSVILIQLRASSQGQSPSCTSQPADSISRTGNTMITMQRLSLWGHISSHLWSRFWARALLPDADVSDPLHLKLVWDLK